MYILLGLGAFYLIAFALQFFICKKNNLRLGMIIPVVMVIASLIMFAVSPYIMAISLKRRILVLAFLNVFSLAAFMMSLAMNKKKTEN